MSDYPTHARYRITASKLSGEPVATLRASGDDQPIKWEALETDNEEQVWFFEPRQGYQYTYFIRNAKYPDSYLEFHGAPETHKGLVSQTASFHSWEVEKLSSQNSFCMKVGEQSSSYYITAANGYQLQLDAGGWYNLYFELVQ